MNAAVALAAVQVLQEQLPVGDAAIRKGLLTVRWPGRLQMVKRPSGRKILLDGAHNSGGATALRSALEEHFPNAKPTLILGIMQDKDWDLMCEILAPLASRILCSPVGSERSAEPNQLRDACRRTNPDAQAATCASLSEAIKLAGKDPFVVVAGSLYLIGEAMELLHLAAVPASDEKVLNQWNAELKPSHV
jgi:dihydrofolate synthase/folylpolyglutamate synthase